MLGGVIRRERATLGGGCFWCIEAVLEQVKGVESVVSGYAGGRVPNPTYEAVCDGVTGHAEVVQATFDPDVVTFPEILEIFFSVHDPTTPNRQGNDVGEQYRSIILHESPDQRAAAEKAREAAAALWDDPVVTEIMPLDRFWPAEAHHQGYYRRNPTQGYCRAIIAPKVQKFRRTWASKLTTS